MLFNYECNECHKILASASGMRKHQQKRHGFGGIPGMRPYNFSAHQVQQMHSESEYDESQTLHSADESEDGFDVMIAQHQAPPSNNNANPHDEWYHTMETTLESVMHNVAELSQQVLSIQDNLRNFQRVRMMDTDNQRQLDDHVCCICMERERTHIFNPCGHYVLCQYCTEMCNTCPICKAEFTNIIKVYTS